MSGINIAGIAFPTKAAAQRQIRTILGRTSTFDVLKGDDLTFVAGLLDLHPHKEEIVGCGVRAFEVEFVPHNLRHLRFMVRRTDGSICDWSWRHSLTPPSQLEWLVAVLRTEVFPQIRQFKADCFATRQTVPCHHCGKILTLTAGHVDHVAPVTFSALVQDWLMLEVLEPEDIEIAIRTNYETSSILKDADLTGRWKDFHRDNAVLSMACPPCNLGALRRLQNEI